MRTGNMSAFTISEDLLMEIIAGWLVEEGELPEGAEGMMFLAPREDGGLEAIVYEGMIQ